MSSSPAAALPAMPPAAAPLTAPLPCGPAPLPFLRLPLGPLATAPGDARATAVAHLRLWGYAPFTDLEAVELITSELVTNAVNASQRGAKERGIEPAPVLFTLEVREQAVRIEVWDPDSALPPAEPELPADDMDVTGRGLFLVAALAARWNASPAKPCGKCVWAELAHTRSAK